MNYSLDPALYNVLSSMNSFLFSFPPHPSLLLLTMCSRKIGSYSMKSLLSLHRKEDFFVNLHFQEDVIVFKRDGETLS